MFCELRHSHAFRKGDLPDGVVRRGAVKAPKSWLALLIVKFGMRPEGPAVLLVPASMATSGPLQQHLIIFSATVGADGYGRVRRRYITPKVDQAIPPTISGNLLPCIGIFHHFAAARGRRLWAAIDHDRPNGGAVRVLIVLIPRLVAGFLCTPRRCVSRARLLDGRSPLRGLTGADRRNGRQSPAVTPREKAMSRWRKPSPECKGLPCALPSASHLFFPLLALVRAQRQMGSMIAENPAMRRRFATI